MDDARNTDQQSTRNCASKPFLSRTVSMCDRSPYAIMFGIMSAKALSPEGARSPGFGANPGGLEGVGKDCHLPVSRAILFSEVGMTTITVTLPDDRLEKLKETAKQLNVPPEELVRISIEELLAQPDETFQLAVGYVLGKNHDLYRRLS